MKTDLRKCCFCVPLRRGLLIWAYVKLIVSSLVILAFTTNSIRLLNRLSEYEDAVTFLLCVTTTIPELLDLSFTIVLIVAAHKKNLKMLQIYYYYSITMLAVYTLVVMLSACNIQKFKILHDMIFHHCWILEFDYYVLLAIGAWNICLQSYLMLLVRTEVHKLYKRNCIKEKFARQKSSTSFKVIGSLPPARPVLSITTSSNV